MRTEAFKNTPKIPEINYEQSFGLRLVDMDKEQKYTWLKFAVTQNFTIFVTPHLHEYLFDRYGVDLDRTLTEGSIWFDDNGKIEKLTFKDPIYQPRPEFTGSSEDLTKLQEAIEKILRKTFQSETEKNKSYLITN